MIPEIEEVKSLWHQARRRHVPVMLGCACGAMGGHVSAADFEMDLIAFLEHRYPTLVGGDAGGPESEVPRSLIDVLDRLATSDDGLGQSLLDDVKRSLASFSPPRRFSAERVN